MVSEAHHAVLLRVKGHRLGDPGKFKKENQSWVGDVEKQSWAGQSQECLFQQWWSS